MKRIQIDCSKIVSWETFHDYFKITFGFPDYYGNNMNAWIDCMSSIDCPEEGMTTVSIEKGGILVLELKNVKDFKDNYLEQYEAIVECSAFVNHRLLEDGSKPYLMLSF